MKKATIFIVLAMLLIATTIVYAKTITVDGDGSEWIPAEIVVDDPDSDNGSGGQDIDKVYFTNNSTTAYFRVDTVTNTDFSGTSVMGVCVDSIPAAGVAVAGCNNDPAMDYAIVIDPNLDCAAGLPLSLITLSPFSASAPASLSRVTNATVTEIEIALTDIGVTVDGTILPIIVSKDISCDFLGGDFAVTNGTTIPHPIVGTGSPTAITLTNVQSESQPAVLVILVVFMAVALLGTTAIIKKRSTI